MQYFLGLKMKRKFYGLVHLREVSYFSIPISLVEVLKNFAEGSSQNISLQRTKPLKKRSLIAGSKNERPKRAHGLLQS